MLTVYIRVCRQDTFTHKIFKKSELKIGEKDTNVSDLGTKVDTLTGMCVLGMKVFVFLAFVTHTWCCHRSCPEVTQLLPSLFPSHTLLLAYR